MELASGSSICCFCGDLNNVASVFQRKSISPLCTILWNGDSVAFYNNTFCSLCRCFQNKWSAVSFCKIHGIIRTKNYICFIFSVCFFVYDIICNFNAFIAAYTVNYVSSIYRIYCIKVLSTDMFQFIVSDLYNCISFFYCFYCNFGIICFIHCYRITLDDFIIKMRKLYVIVDGICNRLFHTSRNQFGGIAYFQFLIIILCP